MYPVSRKPPSTSAACSNSHNRAWWSLPGSVSKLVCPKDDLMIPRYYLLSVTEKLAYGWLSYPPCRQVRHQAEINKATALPASPPSFSSSPSFFRLPCVTPSHPEGERSCAVVKLQQGDIHTSGVSLGGKKERKVYAYLGLIFYWRQSLDIVKLKK